MTDEKLDGKLAEFTTLQYLESRRRRTLEGIRRLRSQLNSWERKIKAGESTLTGRTEIEDLLVDRSEWDVLAEIAEQMGIKIPKMEDE